MTPARMLEIAHTLELAQWHTLPTETLLEFADELRELSRASAGHHVQKKPKRGHDKPIMCKPTTYAADDDDDPFGIVLPAPRPAPAAEPVAARPLPRAAEPRVMAPAFHPDFEATWAAYPRKVGKAQAYAAWKSAPAADRELIAFAVQQYAAEMRGTEAQFIQHGATWYRQRKHEDYRERFGPAEDEPAADVPAAAPAAPVNPEPDFAAMDYRAGVAAFNGYAKAELDRIGATAAEIMQPAPGATKRNAALRRAWRLRLIGWLVHGRMPQGFPSPLDCGERAFPDMTRELIVVASMCGRVRDGREIEGVDPGADGFHAALKIR